MKVVQMAAFSEGETGDGNIEIDRKQEKFKMQKKISLNGEINNLYVCVLLI